MNDDHSPTGERYGHLRAQAAAQKAGTLKRLEAALHMLQMQGRPVTGATIVAVGGPAFAVIRRNSEAYTLYQQHSTFHQGAAVVPRKSFAAREPLSGRTRTQLARDMQKAWSERDEAVAERDQITERYRRLLAEHQQWGETIARLEAALVNEEFRKRLVDFAKLEHFPREG